MLMLTLVAPLAGAAGLLAGAAGLACGAFFLGRKSECESLSSEAGPADFNKQEGQRRNEMS